MSYLVCSTQRSGSTWFCSLLEQTGVAGKPVREYWNLGVEHAAHSERRFPCYQDYLAYVREQSVTRNGMHGLNIMWRQMPLAFARMRSIEGWHRLNDLELWQRAFPCLDSFIFTYREDVLGQAVSWAKAMQTRQFTSEDPCEGEAGYDFWLIDTLYHDIMAFNLAWETWFARFGITPLYIKYEDVVADPLDTLRTTLSFLGQRIPRRFTLQQRFRQQSDGLNADWRRRWLAEAATRHIQVAAYAPA